MQSIIRNMSRRDETPEYDTIHHWLKYHYGKAKKCEMKTCTGKSKNYSWALKRDKNYEKNVKNFLQLCRSCHSKYDTTQSTREKMHRLNRNTSKKECFRHHPFNKDTTWIRTVSKTQKARVCRLCKNIEQNARRKKLRQHKLTSE